MKILVVSPLITPEYVWWWERRINDNISVSSQEDVRPIEEHLQVVSSELEIIKQDFEKRSSELRRKIEQLEEEKMRLGLNVDIYKLEAEKLRKGKNKTEEDLNSLKADNKKLRLSIRTAECRNEEARLKARAAKLERLLHLCRSRNSMIELRASLSKIEELEGRIKELEDALQNSKLRLELLDRRNEQCQEQLHHSQSQIKDRDYIIESSRGRELASLLRRVKALSIRAKPYMGHDKRESSVVNSGDDLEDPAYPPGFAPTNIQAQQGVHPQRVPVTIISQFQVGASVSMNFQTGLGSNPGDNPTNPVVPDLDDVAEMEKARVDLSKQLEDRCFIKQDSIERPEGARKFCEFHTEDGHDIQRYTEFKTMVQNLIDNKELEFYEEIKGLEEKEVYASKERSAGKVQRINHPVVIISKPKSIESGIQIEPRVIIQKPISFPYKDSKKVPWSYNCNVTIPGEESLVNASEED
ncbi:hypothetical protein Goshw_005354 [Gossypium schwendimanii]|uniref:Uncharacterized protein n=2 Tax=Gossypium schwendimanii TaxID=34291 RepID=A0A7J9MA56_GOSSC|nr:hypothetical protein [Gossypium schwendimanii]